MAAFCALFCLSKLGGILVRDGDGSPTTRLGIGPSLWVPFGDTLMSSCGKYTTAVVTSVPEGLPLILSWYACASLGAQPSSASLGPENLVISCSKSRWPTGNVRLGVPARAINERVRSLFVLPCNL